MFRTDLCGTNVNIDDANKICCYASKKSKEAEAASRYELTRREHTILQLLMNGEDNTDICEELVITANTLKKHILNIYRKLGIKNRVQLFKMIKEYE